MSHIVKLSVEIHNLAALATACERLGYEISAERHAVHFPAGVACGYTVKIPGWRFPVVVSDDGEVVYDNYAGRWGDTADLNRLVQEYTAQVVEMTAVSAGQTCWREQRADGTVVVVVGG